VTVVSTAVERGDRWRIEDVFKRPPVIRRRHFGHVTERPDLKFVSMSEEHGHLDNELGERKPAVGDKLTIVPNHVCACVNLHDQIYYYRDGLVEGSWKIEGRGKVR